MNYATDAMVEAALDAYGDDAGPGFHEQRMRAAIKAALSVRAPPSIRCPECVKLNEQGDERLGVRK